jgi:hypothetical protein
MDEGNGGSTKSGILHLYLSFGVVEERHAVGSFCHVPAEARLDQHRAICCRFFQHIHDTRHKILRRRICLQGGRKVGREMIQAGGSRWFGFHEIGYPLASVIGFTPFLLRQNSIQTGRPFAMDVDGSF